MVGIVGIAMASAVAVKLLGCSGEIRRAHPATGLPSGAHCLRYEALLNDRRARVAQTQYLIAHAGLGDGKRLREVRHPVGYLLCQPRGVGRIAGKP